MRAPQGSRRREKSYEMKFGKFFGGALLRITLPCVKNVQPRAHLQRDLLVREEMREDKIIELQHSRKTALVADHVHLVLVEMDAVPCVFFTVQTFAGLREVPRIIFHPHRGHRRRIRPINHASYDIVTLRATRRAYNTALSVFNPHNLRCSCMAVKTNDFFFELPFFRYYCRMHRPTSASTYGLICLLCTPNYIRIFKKK